MRRLWVLSDLQVPTALGAFGDDASRLQLAIDYLSKETA